MRNRRPAVRTALTLVLAAITGSSQSVGVVVAVLAALVLAVLGATVNTVRWYARQTTAQQRSLRALVKAVRRPAGRH